MRWVWRAESGAGKVEYAALVVLVAVILGGLIAAGLPTDVKPAVASATCELLGGDDCEPGENGGGGSPDGPSGPSGPAPETSPGDPDSSAAPNEPGGTADEPGGDPVQAGAGSGSELDEQIEKAENDLAAAEKAEKGAKSDYGKLDDELLQLLKELIGLEDAEKCFFEGDVQACLWTALEAIPWGKALKFVRKIPKAYKLFDKWRKGSKALDKATNTVGDRRKKLKELKDKKKKEQEKKEPKVLSCTRKGMGGSKTVANSFVAGSLVLMGDGVTRVPIEAIDVGDEVLAADPVTGEWGSRPVIDVITGTGHKTLVKVTVIDSNGDKGVITATDAHPFWAAERTEWVDAIALEAGTLLHSADGTLAKVARTDIVKAPDQSVYNLTVDDLHTYHVGIGSLDAVLVHNSGSEPLVPGQTCDLEGGKKKWLPDDRDLPKASELIKTRGQKYQPPPGKKGRQKNKHPLTGGPKNGVYYNVNPQTGKVSTYSVYDENGMIYKRVDLDKDSAPHGGVGPPHVVYYERNEYAPGKIGIKEQDKVRKTTPDEEI